MKKYTIILASLLCYTFQIHGDIIYTKKEFNNLSNRAYALQIELDLLREDFKAEKDSLNARIAEFEAKIGKAGASQTELRIEKDNVISNLNAEIDDLKRKQDEDSRLSKLRTRDLEKQIEILKSKSTNREQELFKDMKGQEDRYLNEINSLKQSLKEERGKNTETIAALNDQLLQWKQILDRQTNKLNEIENQARAMEEGLKREIEEGSLRVKRLKDRLIINIDDKILFDSGSASLKPEVQATLKTIADILAKNLKSKIIIEGHTDNIPIHTRKFRDNWELSTERSLSVLNYILDKTSLSPTRISCQGFGAYSPVAANDTRENRQKNRRVDIVVIPENP